jgi:hypothetical protein
LKNTFDIHINHSKILLYFNMWQLILIFTCVFIGICLWQNSTEEKNKRLYTNLAVLFWILSLLILLFYIYTTDNIKAYMCGCKHYLE